MSSQNARKESKMGRPRIDSEELRARVDRCVIDALDSYSADESMTRPQAIRAILADWLRTHGYKIVFKTKPSGPATDAVRMMDVAISDHRKSKTKAEPLKRPAPSSLKRTAKSGRA